MSIRAFSIGYMRLSPNISIFCLCPTDTHLCFSRHESVFYRNTHYRNGGYDSANVQISEVFLFLVVEGDEDGEHRGEGPEGGASVAHEW